jgi:hypothetical protein
MYIGSLPSFTNREDWDQSITVVSSSGAPVDITGASISLGLRDQKNKTQLVGAQVGNGITLTDPVNGVFQWLISADQVRGLCQGTYDVGIVIALNGGKRQLFAGTVPVVDGIVND